MVRALLRFAPASMWSKLWNGIDGMQLLVDRRSQHDKIAHVGHQQYLHIPVSALCVFVHYVLVGLMISDFMDINSQTTRDPE